MPTFNSDLLPDQSGRNLGNNSQTWSVYSGTVTSTGAITTSSTVSGSQLVSTVSTGTAPMVISSTTQVGNLNVSQLEGKTWESPGTIGSTTPSQGAFTTLTANSLVLNGGAALSSSGQTGTGSLVLSSNGQLTTPTITQPVFNTYACLVPVSGQQIFLGGIVYSYAFNTTVNANTTGVQGLGLYNLPGGLLNGNEKVMRVRAGGVYTTQSGQTPTITFALWLGLLQVATWTTGATTAGQGGLPWNIDFLLGVAVPGSSAQVQGVGNLNIRLGSGAGANTSYASSLLETPVDLTTLQPLQLQVSFSTNPGSGAANGITQQLFTVEVMN